MPGSGTLAPGFGEASGSLATLEHRFRVLGFRVYRV